MQEGFPGGDSFHAFEPVCFGGEAFGEALIAVVGADFGRGFAQVERAFDEAFLHFVAVGGVGLNPFGIIKQGGAVQFFVSPVQGRICLGCWSRPKVKRRSGIHPEGFEYARAWGRCSSGENDRVGFIQINDHGCGALADADRTEARVHAHIHFGDARLRVEMLALVTAQRGHHRLDADLALLLFEYADGCLAPRTSLAESGKKKIGIIFCKMELPLRF